MHFKKGILGIGLKYNVIPPRYYTKLWNTDLGFYLRLVIKLMNNNN